MDITKFKEKLESLVAPLNTKKEELSNLLATEETLETEEAKSEFSLQRDSLVDEIIALEQQAKEEYKIFTALNPVAFDLSAKSNTNQEDVDGVNDLLAALAVKSGEGTMKKKTIGQFVGDYLESVNVKSYDDFDRFFTTSTRLTFQLGEDDRIAEAEVKSLAEIKGIYSNNGVQLVSGTPVPGFQGYGCTIFEVADECRLCIEPSTFKDCLTMRTMPTGNVIQYDYPVSRTDNAAAVLEHVTNPYPTVIQNGTKPSSTFTYDTAKVSVSKIAHWIEASDEVLDDCSKVADRIDFHLTTGLMDELDRQLIAGTGINGELMGLLSTVGRLDLDADDLTVGIDTPNIYDKLYLAKLELEQNCANVDCVIINPADKAKVALAKDANGNYLFPQGPNCEVTSVGCFTLKTSPHVPVGTAIMGELRNNWIWYVRKSMEVRVGMKGLDFINNQKTFLAEIRGAAIVLCPLKIATITNI